LSWISIWVLRRDSNGKVFWQTGHLKNEEGDMTSLVADAGDDLEVGDGLFDDTRLLVGTAEPEGILDVRERSGRRPGRLQI
jgi:hypothetical protein